MPKKLASESVWGAYLILTEDDVLANREGSRIDRARRLSSFRVGMQADIDKALMQARFYEGARSWMERLPPGERITSRTIAGA